MFEDSQDSEDSMDVDSSELEEEDEENPHGFVWAHQLDTFKKSKRDRLEEQRQSRDQEG